MSEPTPPPPGGARWTAPPPEQPMSLLAHLGELRARLVRVLGAVLLFSVGGMWFAKPLFAYLMKPVLAALPAGERTLIYTSGIEEVNVLLKVGLYAGILLATPVILWQLWGFISPGLLPEERRHAAPFILAGTLAFVAGVAFCYFVVLPQMFQFLLAAGDERQLEQSVRASDGAAEDALRFLRLGEAARAGELAREHLAPLAAAAATGPVTASEVAQRLAALGQLIDALETGFPGPGRPVLVRAMEKRLEAQRAHAEGKEDEAAALGDAAAAQAAAVSPQGTDGVADLWRLAKARARVQTQATTLQWTRPMLSMGEQLSLVIVLELAFGLVFELPLVLVLLTVLGVVQASFLVRYQRHAFLVCLILAAVLTPTGDVVNLALMGGPLVLCYEIGTLASWLIERRRARARSLVPVA